MNELKKSIKILKNLQLKNGAITATPVDGAYPYVYVRDGVMITKALNITGNTKNSEKFYHFIKKNSRLNQYNEIFQRYHKDGWPSVSRKDQNDNPGLLIHGIYHTYLHGKNKEFLNEMWDLVKKCSEFIIGFINKGLIKTGTSIHERYRLEQGYEIWSNCACTRGLYDAGEIAYLLGHFNEAKKYRKKAKIVHNNILTKMFNKKTGLYKKNLKYPHISDSSQISPFYFNLDDSKRRLKKTLHHLEKHLWHKEVGGFRRFKKFEVVRDWHWYTGGSGGWIMFTAIIGRLYRRVNNNRSCKKCVKWIEEVGKRTNGLLPEHIATKKEYEQWKYNEIEFNSRILKGMKKSESLNKKFKRRFKEDIVYWAIPLGWSHAEYILLKKSVNNKNV